MGFFRRVLSFLQFMAYAVWHVLRRGRGYDVMIASSGPLTLAVPALIGRWLRCLPFVFEVIDVWPDSAIAAGVLRNPLLKWLSFRLEALAYKYASAIVTCSTGMTERVKNKIGADSGIRGSGNKAKVATVSNCCDLELFSLDGENRRKTRERMNVRDDQLVALYTGAMGLSNAIPDLTEAVRLTAGDERVVWWFAGDGRHADKLKDLGEKGAETCRFFGSLSKGQVVELYLAADVNMVTFMHAPLFYENSPNKFFDGIAAGLPAVFNRTTWLGPWLTQYECGIVCQGDASGKEMADVICELAADKGRLQRMGLGARRLAEEVFSRDKLATEYLGIVEQAARDGCGT